MDMGMDMDIVFDNRYEYGYMSMIFKNGYECRYDSVGPKPTLGPFLEEKGGGRECSGSWKGRH